MYRRISSTSNSTTTIRNVSLNRRNNNRILQRYYCNINHSIRCNDGGVLLSSSRNKEQQQQQYRNNIRQLKEQQQQQQIRCHLLSTKTIIDDSDVDDNNNEVSSSSTPHQIMYQRKHIRNIAVIAHVDHGKTTLVDQMLKASMNYNNSAGTDRLMDSGDLEKERGITITGKVTRLIANNNNNELITINCADTPGHSDFSGEVDRYLSMSDGFVLVVDAAEGPKTQTKYVLSRALKLGLKPIVVLNKCDRPTAAAKIDSGETEEKLYDLFHSLLSTSSSKNNNHNLSGDSNDPNHRFITLYASAKDGWITDDPIQALEFGENGYDNNPTYSMKHLLDYIIQEIPEPIVQYYGNHDTTSNNDVSSMDGMFFANDKLSMAAVTVGNDTYLGRTCTGRIVSGSIGVGDNVMVMRRNSDTTTTTTTTPFGPSSNITGLFIFEGINRVPLKDGRAYAGDVVTIAGIPDSIAVGDTITSVNNPVSEPIDTPPLAPPTLCMDFGANDGPLAGKDGTQISSSKIRARLLAETDNNVTLKVEPSLTDSEKTVVYARGELQLGILIEQMRREGFEIVISPPRIITRTCPDTNRLLEPYEEVIIDVDSEYAGTVISALTGDRRGVLIDMSESSATDGKTTLTLEVPSRGLLGFSSEIATSTKGSAIVNHLFLEDRVHSALGSGLVKSKLIANDAGKATGYSLGTLSARGVLFIEPGDDVYSGMVIGENAKTGDLEVNPIRSKEKTNMRTVSKDEKVVLPPPKRMSVEELIGYMVCIYMCVCF